MSDELDGRRDPSSGHSKELLLGYIRQVRDYRAIVREANSDKAEVKKEAKAAGFDARKIEEVAMWLDKVDKHGRAEMEEAEAIFELYRAVADGGAKDFDEIMTDARDRALLKIFAPDDQMKPKALTKKQKLAAEAVAYAQVSQFNGGQN